MRVLSRDEEEGFLKLSIDNTDDLWHLYNIIRPGDRVFGVSFRASDKPSDILRSKKTEKKRVYLGISVEKLEFQKFSDRLRVHGIIVEGEEGLNSYHTLNFQAGETIKIIKDVWGVAAQERISNAISQSGRGILIIVSIDDEDAVIAFLRSYGPQELGTVRSGRTGKMYASTGNTPKEYYGQVLSVIQQNWSEGIPVVIVGPGFTPSELKESAKEKKLAFSSMMFCEATAHSGTVGIYEAVKRGIINKVDSGNRMAREIDAVEELATRIVKDEPSAYGMAEIRKALDLGAVETLIIHESIIWNLEIQDIMSVSEKTGANLLVISGEHEGGKKLEGLGGAGALLRFSIN